MNLESRLQSILKVQQSKQYRNIIQMHNNVSWDWQYSAEHIQTECGEYSVECCWSRRPLLWIWMMLWHDVYHNLLSYV